MSCVLRNGVSNRELCCVCILTLTYRFQSLMRGLFFQGELLIEFVVVHRELTSIQSGGLVWCALETVKAESGQAFASAVVRPRDRTLCVFQCVCMLA